jgi:hypothetical protein
VLTDLDIPLTNYPKLLQPFSRKSLFCAFEFICIWESWKALMWSSVAMHFDSCRISRLLKRLASSRNFLDVSCFSCNQLHTSSRLRSSDNSDQFCRPQLPVSLSGNCTFRYCVTRLLKCVNARYVRRHLKWCCTGTNLTRPAVHFVQNTGLFISPWNI